jgi:hypothetical protein
MLRSISIPFRAEYRTAELWGWAFPKGTLTENQRAQLKMIKPYFLGQVTLKDHDPLRFEKAAEFLIEIAYGPLIRILRLRVGGVLVTTTG